MADPWRIHFSQRVRVDDERESIPALEFFESISTQTRAKLFAVLQAVADAPPPQFSGGGMWEAMRDDMSGMYEIRVSGDGLNHRLFCVLDREGKDLGGPSIVCIAGLSKAKRSAASDRDYRRIRKLRDEFLKHRRVA